jgi:hypothetical protein
MLRLLGLAWSAWKLSRKRFGPLGGAIFAVGTILAFVLLREYLEEDYPNLGNALDELV